MKEMRRKTERQSKKKDNKIVKDHSTLLTAIGLTSKFFLPTKTRNVQQQELKNYEVGVRSKNNRGQSNPEHQQKKIRTTQNRQNISKNGPRITSGEGVDRGVRVNVLTLVERSTGSKKGKGKKGEGRMISYTCVCMRCVFLGREFRFRVRKGSKGRGQIFLRLR